MKQLLLTLSLLAGLSGCVEPTTVTVDGSTFPAAPVRVAAPAKGGASVGDATPTAKQAAQIFNAACVDTLPDFKGTAAAVSGFGMRADPSGGAYLSPKLNLSVALVRTGSTVTCSMIFATKQDPKTVADQLASYAVSKKKRLFVAVIGQSGDLTYLNAQIAAQ